MGIKLEKIGKEWISNIPSHWKMDRIKDLCIRVTGGGTPKSNVTEFWENGDIIWVSPTDFSKYKNNKYISNSEKKITKLGLQKSSANILPKGSVIMSSRASIGDAKISTIELTTNQGFISFVTSWRLDNCYLFYAIECQLGEYFKNIASGTTFMEISRKIASNEYLPLPPLKEQKAIAQYLDEATQKIDRTVAIKKEQLGKLEDTYTNTLTKWFISGVESNSEMSETGCFWFPLINSRWALSPLKRVLKTKLKYGANESAENENREEPRYIRITDFGNDGKLKNNTFKSLPMVKAENFLLSNGDVLFARSGATVGKTFIFEDYDGLACFAGYLIKAECDRSKMLPKFLYYYTKTKNYDEWKNLVFTQATIQNIGADKYQYLSIPVPEISEQQNIIDAIDKLNMSIDKSKANIEAQIKTLQSYRKSLIHECVTGKKQICEM